MLFPSPAQSVYLLAIIRIFLTHWSVRASFVRKIESITEEWMPLEEMWLPSPAHSCFLTCYGRTDYVHKDNQGTPFEEMWLPSPAQSARTDLRKDPERT